MVIPDLKKFSREHLVAAVMDAISGFVTGLTVAAVSVLFVKLGVEKMCADAWCERESENPNTRLE
jgi:hypothetical protein